MSLLHNLLKENDISMAFSRSISIARQTPMQFLLLFSFPFFLIHHVFDVSINMCVWEREREREIFIFIFYVCVCAYQTLNDRCSCLPKDLSGSSSNET